MNSEICKESGNKKENEGDAMEMRTSKKRKQRYGQDEKKCMKDNENEPEKIIERMQMKGSEM